MQVKVLAVTTSLFRTPCGPHASDAPKNEAYEPRVTIAKSHEYLTGTAKTRRIRISVECRGSGARETKWAFNRHPWSTSRLALRFRQKIAYERPGVYRSERRCKEVAHCTILSCIHVEVGPTVFDCNMGRTGVFSTYPQRTTLTRPVCLSLFGRLHPTFTRHRRPLSYVSKTMATKAAGTSTPKASSKLERIQEHLVSDFVRQRVSRTLLNQTQAGHPSQHPVNSSTGIGYVQDRSWRMAIPI